MKPQNGAAEPAAPLTTSSAPAYLLPDEVATMLRIDVKTAYRWAADKRVGIPVVRIRGVVRFPREALLAWLAAGGQQPRRRSKRLPPSSPKPASGQESTRA